MYYSKYFLFINLGVFVSKLTEEQQRPLFSKVPSFPANVFILFHVLPVYHLSSLRFLFYMPAQVKAGDRGAFSMQMSGFQSGASAEAAA